MDVQIPLRVLIIHRRLHININAAHDIHQLLQGFYVYGNVMMHRHPQKACHGLLQKGKPAIIISIIQPFRLRHARYLCQRVAGNADDAHGTVLMAEAEQKQIVSLLPRVLPACIQPYEKYVGVAVKPGIKTGRPQGTPLLVIIINLRIDGICLACPAVELHGNPAGRCQCTAQQNQEHKNPKELNPAFLAQDLALALHIQFCLAFHGHQSKSSAEIFFSSISFLAAMVSGCKRCPLAATKIMDWVSPSSTISSSSASRESLRSSSTSG